MSTTSSFHLFGPPGKKDPGLKDLLFKDSAVQLKQIPSLMDAQLYLGFEYYSAVQSLQKGRQDIKHQCHVSMGCLEELTLANTAKQKEHDFFRHRLYHLENVSCEITEPSQISLTSTKEFVVSKPKSPHSQIWRIYTNSTPVIQLVVEIGHGQNCCLEKVFLGCKKKEHLRTPGSDT